MSRAKVARAAGVTRATFKHYIDLGLLPEAAFTGPNMAYYDPACVERIRLVRELRERRHLPLREIAKMFAAQGAERVAQALRVTRALRADLLDGLAGEHRTPVSREQLLAVPGMDERVLADLEALGLMHPPAGSKGPSYDALSLKMAESVGVMRAGGLTEEAGFEVGDLSVYVERLAQLVRDEVRLFNERVLGHFDPPTEERYMRTALRGADALVLAVRDRLLADLLEEAPSRDPRTRRKRRHRAQAPK
jgi:DNA-binding transcriptional MerR regulator